MCKKKEDFVVVVKDLNQIRTFFSFAFKHFKKMFKSIKKKGAVHSNLFKLNSHKANSLTLKKLDHLLDHFLRTHSRQCRQTAFFNKHKVLPSGLTRRSHIFEHKHSKHLYNLKEFKKIPRTYVELEELFLKDSEDHSNILDSTNYEWKVGSR